MKKYRVLILALLFSAIWHILWLSAVSVVVVPKPEKMVRFSGVSFLGPILDKGAFKISVESRERTPAEKHYLDYIGGIPGNLTDNATRDEYEKLVPVGESITASGEDLSGLIIAAIDNHKIEPGRDIY